MSASDKKQQRKAAMSEGLPQKQQWEQKEARSAKQKKTIYMAVGIVCAVLAAALLVWNGWSSISDRMHSNAVAATVDGVDYTVGDLQYYYSNARQNLYSQWYSFAMYGYNIGFDPNVDDGAQWYNESENKTYADYFRESALTSLKRTSALCAAAKSEGYTLSEEGQKTIDSQMAQYDAYRIASGLSWDNYLARVFGTGMTKEVLVRNLTNDVLASEFSSHHEEGIEVSESDIQDYYTNHTDDLDSFDYRSFFINGTAADPVDENGDPMKNEDGTTVTATQEEKDAALAAAKAQADAAVAEITDAEDREAAFIAAAPKYVSEATRGAYENDANYSLSSNVMGNTLSSNTSPYATWLKDAARVKGDVTSIETSSGYFVVMFLERKLDNDPTVNVRHILVLTDTSDSTEKDANGYAIPTQAARDAAQAEAQKIWDEWKAGEATEESFAELAEKYSEDGRSDDEAVPDGEKAPLTNPGGLYEEVYKGEMVPSFNDWVFTEGRKAGDVGMVEYMGRYSGWHVIYFSGVAEDPHWRILAEDNTKSSMQSDWVNALNEAIEAVEADGMKYVGSANTATPTPSASPAESTPVESQPAESEQPTESAPAESQSAE